MTNTSFVESLSTKLCETILSNEEFTQKICDSIALDCKKDIDALQEEVKVTRAKTHDLEEKIEMQEQYSRRNCLLIHGVLAEKNEDTNEVVKRVFKNHLSVEVKDNEIDRSHRLGKSNAGNPIIVKLVRHDVKNLIYYKKKLLKGKSITITEALTSSRRACLKKLETLRQKKKVLSYWTADGKIFYTTPNEPEKKSLL